MKRIHYCIPTYKSFELCRQSIEAVMRGSYRPDIIHVIDNSPDRAGMKHLNDAGTLDKYNIKVYPQGQNIGVGPAWNKFFEYIDEDYTIIANDDIAVHNDTIESMVLTADRETDQIFFAGSGESGNAFSLFLLTKLGFNLIGRFDEKFFPAYFEDNDYFYRMKLAGYSIRTVDSATYDHVGSSTLKSYTAIERQLHDRAFLRNQTYYQFKWGGMPGNETLTEPRSL